MTLFLWPFAVQSAQLVALRFHLSEAIGSKLVSKQILPFPARMPLPETNFSSGFGTTSFWAFAPAMMKKNLPAQHSTPRFWTGNHSDQMPASLTRRLLNSSWAASEVT